MKRSSITPPLGMGDRMAHLMEASGMSDSKLAERIGIDRRTIRAYRINEASMNVTVCMKICAHLKTTPNYLILGKE